MIRKPGDLSALPPRELLRTRAAVRFANGQNLEAIMVKALAIILATVVQPDSLPVYKMPEVIVTATRIMLPADLSPWPVEVINIKADEVTDLTQALERSVASDVRSYGYEGHSAFPILGGILASRVLVLANGVHMNSRRDGVIDLSLIPLYPWDRVEIVKGPLSALYGSAAIGGVVNVIPSKESGLAARYEATDQLGMNAGARAAYSWKILGGRASGSYLTAPGFRANDDVTRYNAGVGFWIAPGKALSIEANAAYTWREMGVPGPAPDISDTAFVPPIFGDSLVYSLYDRQADKLMRGNLKTSFGKQAFSGYLNLYAVNQDFIYDWPRQGYSEEGSYTELVNNQYDDLRLGGDLQLSAQLARRFRLAGGLSIEKEMLQVRGIYTDSAADTVTWDYSWDADDSHLGVWTELLAKLGIFVPSAAARLEYSGAYGHFLSPELGLSVVPIPQKFKISAAYGRSFRAPTLNDLFWPADEYSQGNPDLVPERSQSFVLSADARPFRFLKLSAAGSWKDIDDMIAWLPFESGKWRPENVDKVVIWGGELSSSWQVAEGLFSGSLGLTYNYAREIRRVVTYSDWVTGETRTDTVTRQAAFIPPLILKGNVAIHAWKGGKVSAEAAWTAKRINYYPDYSPYPEVDVLEKTIAPSLKIELGISQKLFNLLTVEIGVKNLTNDQTAAHFGGYDDLDYPTAPRRFYGSVSITY